MKREGPSFEPARHAELRDEGGEVNLDSLISLLMKRTDLRNRYLNGVEASEHEIENALMDDPGAVGDIVREIGKVDEAPEVNGHAIEVDAEVLN